MNQHSYKIRINPVRKSAAGKPNARRLISNRAFCLALTVATIISGTAMAEEPSVRSPKDKLRLASIEPTVFFIKEENALLQMVEVNIENTSEAMEASVEVKPSTGRLIADLKKKNCGSWQGEKG